VPAEAVFSFTTKPIASLCNDLRSETVRHIMCLHDQGPSDGPKWMVDDEELGDATGDALDDSQDGTTGRLRCAPGTVPLDVGSSSGFLCFAF
jgi:hypothetical protein